MQKLHAVGRQHRHQFDVSAQLPTQFQSQFDVQSARFLRGGIDSAKRTAGQQNTDHQGMTLLDLVERRIRLNSGAGGQRDQGARYHRH
ncbi:hypothetical protein D3C84_1104950 [compost metagenome]